MRSSMLPMRAFLVAGSAMALCLAAGQTFAAEAGPKGDPENPDFGTRVEELVVTGQGVATSAPVRASLEATEPQSIVTRKAIDQFIPTTADYTQILNLTPSLSGTSFNGPGLGEAKTVLRGFKDGEYNITYDGIPWGDANGPSHHSTSFFPSSTIGAVVVDRGPGEAGQMGVASFGGSVNIFSPEVSHERGGSQAFTLGSWGTVLAVTKLNTGDISQLNGTHALFNFQELRTNGALSYNNATAYNQLARIVIPLMDSWKLTVLGTYNYTKINTNDNAGATLEQVGLYGKNYALNNDPTTPNYKGYNLVTKHTYFNYANLNGDVTSSLKLDDTLYSYYYKNDTESSLDPTLSVADIAAKKGLQIVQVPGGKAVVNGHVPGYTKLNVYKIYGNILRLDQTVPFGTIKAGLWLEHADTGPRARYDYDATLGKSITGYTPDYRQKVVAGVPQYVEYVQYSGWDQYQPFVDVEWKVNPKLTVTPGIKYVHEELSVDADVNQSSREPIHSSKTFTKTLYFLTANYKVMDNLAVYGQYATGFLIPDVSATQKTKPNLSQLEPQESTNYQLGAVYHGSTLSLDADVYYVDFTNKLQTFFNPTTLETEQFNLGGATYQGIEGQATWQATKGITLFANGSLNSAKTQGVNNAAKGIVILGGKQIAGAPKSTAAVGFILSNDQGFTLSLINKYTGEQWGAEGEPAAYKINGYNSGDLTVVKTFGNFRLEGSVYNVFDSQQATSIKPGKTVPYDQYYFQAGRNVQISAKVNF